MKPDAKLLLPANEMEATAWLMALVLVILAVLFWYLLWDRITPDFPEEISPGIQAAVYGLLGKRMAGNKNLC